MSDNVSHTLFKWYRDEFGLRSSRARPELAVLTRFQQVFNDALGYPCSSLSFMNIKRGTRRCNHPMCPSCWHRRMQVVIRRLYDLPEAGVFYVSETEPVKYNREVPPETLRKIKAKDTRLSLVTYVQNYQGPTAKPGEVGTEVFDGRMAYTVLAVLAAPAVVKDYGSDGRGLLVVKNKQKKVVGVVHRQLCTDRTHAIDRFLHRLTHPFKYVKHEEMFTDYINTFKTHRPLGRSWARVNKCLSQRS